MKKHKILYVDDDLDIIRIAEYSFPEYQFELRFCHTGDEALQAVKEDRPDLIILDIVMPGLDGWEVLQRLKSDSKTATIPIIMCTAKESVEDVEKSFKFGAQAYVMKPIVFKQLIKKVSAILDIEELLMG